MRIAIGGFQHETNTFAPSKATFERFARGGAWPPLLRGGEIFDGVSGINLPIAGFVDTMKRTRHELVPTAWAAASPSAHVTEDAYERIAGMILESLACAMPVDAVYLDLHGAMVAEHLDDGEGELLSRVRSIVGPKIPVVASLDLHANVTRRMLEQADVLIAYRTYPHVDMADTGARVAKFLLGRLDGAARPKVVARRVPFLIPLHAQSTMLEPACGIYAELARLEGPGVAALSFTPGFPAADFPECGPVTFAYADDPAAAERAADRLRAIVEEAEADFDAPVFEADECVRRAMALAQRATRPVVIADTQDNPGAGGDSDTTGMLRALIANRAQRAALGLMVDAQAAAIAHAAGEGATIEIALGGKSLVPGDAPLHGRFTVERLSDGRLTCRGPFYRGARMNLGASALLRVDGVKVVVASDNPQMADQAMYRFIGVEPTAEKILVNKSSVHFRADFAPIAAEILVAKAPGPMLADPSEYPWKRLAPGIRLKPRGREFVQGTAPPPPSSPASGGRG
ncbi:MAG TPA: M81 family metallopeptidase [Burkholderiales bacterium]|nr:M81 family metallopeptidase [Burkholderiales bacterium]